MAQTGAKKETRTDLLLGKMALDRRLIGQEQLREALSEQAMGVARGRKLPRRLGVILLEKKYLTDVQLVSLLEEQSSLALEESAQRRDDKLLSRILRARRLALAEDIEAFLKIQSEAIEGCEEYVPRLGEWLVIEGRASEEAVRVAMAIREDMHFYCKSRKCGRVSRHADLDSTKPFCCPGCGGAIDPRIPMPPPEAKPEGPAPTDSPESSLDIIVPEEPPAPEAPPEPELKRLGKYSIVRELGRGGMGVVYEALDEQLHRPLALKLMHPVVHGDKEEAHQEIERFVREARLSANLPRHPNIMSVYEAGVAEGRHYIAMEYVRGHTMAEWRKKGSITIRQQVRLLRDVALAVHHAHEQGILHRDLKPQNIIVDDKNQPFVMDFGLAKRLGQDVSASLTVSGKIVGTPTYMSPEQARGSDRVARHTDIWSLGIMLYEILTGRPPFKGSSPIELMMKILKDPVPPPSSLSRTIASSGLYRTIEGVCMKALQKRPGDRHSSAKEFANDLSRWLKGGEFKISAPPPRRLYGGLLAGAGVLAVLVALVAFSSRPVGAEKALERAEKFEMAGRYEEALKIYDQVLKTDPRNGRAQAGREHAAAKIEAAAAQAEASEARDDLEKLRRRGVQDRNLETRLRAAEEKARQAETRARMIGSNRLAP